MLTLNDYRRLVNDAIQAIPYPAEPENLYAPITYTMQLGGKRLRPTLLLMACDALGGEVKHAIQPAVGLELFHNFTLLHDDVMDDADVRRGQLTVHRRWGDNVAILSGDTMLCIAASHISQVSQHHLPAITALFNKTAIEIMEGQQLDMDYEHLANVTVDNYIEMIRLKTAVLLGCACKMGAIIANAPQEQADALYNMGVNLGLAFQLQDDVLDVWGDEETFGKEIGGDIMNNKKTFLLINAMLLAKDDDATELRRWLNDQYPIKQEKVPAVTAIYERLGLRQLAEDAIADYNQRALDALAKAHLTPEATAAFTELINALVSRKK